MYEIDAYVHRIGRTSRGSDGQVGHVLTLFEYDKHWPELAVHLIRVLQDSAQDVPRELERIADDVMAGKREVGTKSINKRKKANEDEPIL